MNQNQRKENESFEDYKERRKLLHKAEKVIKPGKLIFQASNYTINAEGKTTFYKGKTFKNDQRINKTT